MTDLYKKEGRKYIKVGCDFEGWPGNGYWVVLDGRNSLIAPIEHPRPIELCRLMQYRDQIMDKMEYKPRSMYETVTEVLSLLEEITSNSDVL